MSDQSLSEQVREWLVDKCDCDPGDDVFPTIVCTGCLIVAEIAALEKRLRVSEAKREVERKAADDWQERYDAMTRILARERDVRTTLEGGDDE